MPVSSVSRSKAVRLPLSMVSGSVVLSELYVNREVRCLELFVRLKDASNLLSRTSIGIERV